MCVYVYACVCMCDLKLNVYFIYFIINNNIMLKIGTLLCKSLKAALRQSKNYLKT